MEKLTSADKFRQSRKTQQPAEIAEVTCPTCGSVALFEKPSKFGTVIGMGILPQEAASDAVEAWQEAGVMANGEAATADETVTALAFLKLVKNVLRLSVDPKLVSGHANEAKGEMSAEDAPDCCVQYWCKWVRSGGEASVMLAMFPEGPGPDASSGGNRKKRRATAVKARRAT